MNKEYKLQYTLTKVASNEVAYVTDNKEEFIEHIDKSKEYLFNFEVTCEVLLSTESDDSYFYCVFIDRDDDIRKIINGLESRLIRYYNEKIRENE